MYYLFGGVFFSLLSRELMVGENQLIEKKKTPNAK